MLTLTLAHRCTSLGRNMTQQVDGTIVIRRAISCAKVAPAVPHCFLTIPR